MLVLKRSDGQWVEVVHRSGDVLRIRAYDLRPGPAGRPGRLHLAFDDPPRHFTILRPERATAAADAAAAEGVGEA